MTAFRRLRLAFNNLRAQLLLWVALPVVVSLLTVSLLEILGHEQVMEQMVQKQTQLLSVSIGALIDARVNQNQSVLHHLAGDWADDRAPAASDIAAFPGGVAVYVDGRLVEQYQDVPWSTLPQVQSLVAKVAEEQGSGIATVEDRSARNWLFIQAEPVEGSTPPVVIVGAVLVNDLAAADMFLALRTGPGTEIRLADAEGRIMAIWGQAEDGISSTDKVVSAQTIVAPTGWQVTVREEWQTLVPPLLHFSNAVLVIMVLAVLISLLSAYFGLRHIVRPLQRLDAAVSEVGWGNFAAIQQPVGGVAEIEELREALARMAEQIRLYQRELQSYIGAMTRGQEEERRRLARELHDGTVQDLIALNQRVELAEHELERNPEKTTERLRELRPLLADTMAGLRRQIHNLRPLYLEDLGFVPALEMLMRQVTQDHQLMGDFEVVGEAARRLDPGVEISAFRIVQEALQNAVAHAHAEWVRVELRFEQEGITLCIEDNGRGFDPPTHPYQLAHQDHFGLLGMRERTQLHGGDLHIESKIGHGTIITARLLDRQANSPIDPIGATTNGHT